MRTALVKISSRYQSILLWFYHGIHVTYLKKNHLRLKKLNIISNCDNDKVNLIKYFKFSLI